MRDALELLIAALEHRTLPRLDEALGPILPLCERLLRGAEPLPSLMRLRELVPAVPEGAWPVDGRPLEALALVLSGGPEPSRLLLRRPERLRLLTAQPPDRPHGLEELRQARDEVLADGAVRSDGEVVADGAALAPADPQRLALALTRFRNDQVLRLSACEYLGASIEQVGLELSHVADLCLEAAASHLDQRLADRHGPPLLADGTRARLAVVALGKHGGRELNFCSDIDVIYLYPDDAGQAGALTLHQYFSRLCQDLTRVVGEPNAEGLCFRVDLRLRPEGSRGPICNSLPGLERYYETFGGPWDRLAWLKARAAAGDLELGQQLLQFLRPFVFPRAIRPEIVEQIQELNRRIKAQKHPDQGAWDVKLGTGGIREIEFFVQALQLLHAGKQPALRVAATLPALDRLLYAGLISEEERLALAEAYTLWRRLEHRVQLYAGRQTHRLPETEAERRWLEDHLGMRGTLKAQIAHHRARVQAIYATLGTPVEGDETLLPLLDPELPLAQREALLARAGFQAPARAAEALTVLADRPFGPLGRSPSAAEARLALPLLDELSRCPDPDAALAHLTALALRVGANRGLWTLLEENREALRLLFSLFGASDFLARLFVERPELLDRLLQIGRDRPRRDGDALRAELDRALAEVDPEDLEGRLSLLRRVQREELLRVGLRDIAGELAQEEVWDQLSFLAEVLLERAFPLAEAEAERRYGRPRGPDGSLAGLAVIALGKLGSRELTYGSDLDLVFVYSEEGHTDGPRRVDNAEFFSRLVQRFIRALSLTLREGRLYEVDTRLRPSGNQGMLVCSFEAFRRYHQEQAQLWERQVLIKARFVCGEPGLGHRLHQFILPFVYETPLSEAELRLEVRRLRQRLELEQARERPGVHHLKLGRGGLLDVDFLVQTLQLVHGGRDPSLRGRATLEALAALRQAGHIVPHDAALLDEGYRFLRRLQARLRIMRDREASVLPEAPEALELLGRRLGYRAEAGRGAGARLMDDYLRRTADIRQVFDRVFSDEG